MGFLDALGPALTVGTQAAAAKEQGQAEGQQRSNQNMLTLLNLMRQKSMDEATRQHLAAQTGEANARAYQLTHPRPQRTTFADDSGNLWSVDEDTGVAHPVRPAGGGTPSSPQTSSMPSDATAQGAALPAQPNTPPQLKKLVPPKNPVMGSPEWLAAQEKLAKIRADYAPGQFGTQIKPGSDGQPAQAVVTNARTGDVTTKPLDTVDLGKGTKGTQGALVLQTLARLGMNYNDLSQAVDKMDKLEGDKTFLGLQTPVNKAKIGLASTESNPHPKGLLEGLSNSAMQGVAGLAQRSLDPSLNTYNNLKTRVGTAFTEAMPRPNQQLLQIERGLSGIDVGWNPDLLQSVQSRRRGGLDVLRGILANEGLIDANGNFTLKAKQVLGGKSQSPTAPETPGNIFMTTPKRTP